MPLCDTHDIQKEWIKDKYKLKGGRWRCYLCQYEANLKHRNNNPLLLRAKARIKQRKYRKDNPQRNRKEKAARRALMHEQLCPTCNGDDYINAASGICYICLINSANETDHVMPLAHGGPHCNANFKGICRDCNNTKGARVWPGHPRWKTFIARRQKAVFQTLLNQVLLASCNISLSRLLNDLNSPCPAYQHHKNLSQLNSEPETTTYEQQPLCR